MPPARPILSAGFGEPAAPWSLPAMRRVRARRVVVAVARRLMDVAIALAALAIVSPVLALAVGWRAFHGWPLGRVRRLGLRRRVFGLWRLRLGATRFDHALVRWGVHRWPALFNVLVGQMSVVGPEPVASDAPDLDDPAAARRFAVKPGLVCLWWIRTRANIAYGSQWLADREYVASRSLTGDIGILARAVLAAFYGARVGEPPEAIRLFGLPVTNVTMAEAIRRIVEQTAAAEPRQVCFINADCVNLAFRDPAYRQVLASSWMNLADGIGMKLAGRALGREIRENQCGTDVFLRLCEALAAAAGEPGKSLFLLGGRPGVAADVHRHLAEHYPNTRVAGTHHGYFAAAEQAEVIRQIAQSRADVLLVAFGAPRQDLWIAEHLAATGVNVAMGVGGLFDYYAGRVPRAPLWVREIGMEWAFRLLQEPKRLGKRYLCGNVVFLARLAWWRIRG